MADLRPLAGISQDDSLLLLINLLYEIKDKLPRVDQFDRSSVLLESGSTTAVTGTLTGVTTVTTVTTCTTVTYLSNMGSGTTFHPADQAPMALSVAGLFPFYDRIVVN